MENKKQSSRHKKERRTSQQKMRQKSSDKIDVKTRESSARVGSIPALAMSEAQRLHGQRQCQRQCTAHTGNRTHVD